MLRFPSITLYIIRIYIWNIYIAMYNIYVLNISTPLIYCKVCSHNCLNLSTFYLRAEFFISIFVVNIFVPFYFFLLFFLFIFMLIEYFFFDKKISLRQEIYIIKNYVFFLEKKLKIYFALFISLLNLPWIP